MAYQENLLKDLAYNARLIRRTLRRARQALRYQRSSFKGVPVLFANSFPKSGTHLLTQVLQGFQQIGPAVNSGLPAIVTFNGPTGKPRSRQQILADLQRLLPGDIAYGHLHATPETINFLSQDGVAPYFILRDPRDIVVSHVHYVTDMAPNHVHHRHYSEKLHGFAERLSTSIQGIPGSAVPFPNIRRRFEPYLDWMDCEAVLVLHFEDFIRERAKTLARVYQHAVQRGFPGIIPTEKAVQALANAINPQNSPTFRSGKIGSWQRHFTPKHKALFKDLAGDLLVQLGYEKDNDW